MKQPKYDIWRAHYEVSFSGGEPSLMTHEGHYVFSDVRDMDFLRDLIRMVDIDPKGRAIFGVHLGSVMKVAIWLDYSLSVDSPNKLPFAVYIQVDDPLFTTIKDPKLMARRAMEWPTKQN